MGAPPRVRTRPAVSKYVRSASSEVVGGEPRRTATTPSWRQPTSNRSSSSSRSAPGPPARILPSKTTNGLPYRAVFRSVPAAASHATTALSHEPRPGALHTGRSTPGSSTSCIARHVQPSATASRREPRALRMSWISAAGSVSSDAGSASSRSTGAGPRGAAYTS